MIHNTFKLSHTNVPELQTFLAEVGLRKSDKVIVDKNQNNFNTHISLNTLNTCYIKHNGR